MNRVRNTKLALWLITGFAAAVGVARFAFGLGVTTNMNDYVPWGVWIGLMEGWVALAAGGFVMAAIFYMIKREEFHPYVKLAILTAFLGYSSFVVGLIFDLGLPWNIWHMIIYWNPHSPLFEVGWCVMLYTTVLILEFSPTPLEKYSRYAKIRNVLLKFRLPLVLLGIMLSTLHQSSLGTLFVIMPRRLYPLWYSHILPIQFFISAVAAGLMMLAFENLVLHWIYRRPMKHDLTAELCGISVWVLALYFIVKMADIIGAGHFGMIFNGNWLSYLFIVEILISILIPIALFSVRKWRHNPRVQWIGSITVIVGIALNRVDVAGFAMVGATRRYTPLWTEVAISFGILAVAALVFLMMIEKFNVWDARPVDPDSLPYAAPKFDSPSKAWLGTPNVASLAGHSLAFLFSFAIGFAVLSGTRLHAQGIDNVKASPAVAVDNVADTLCINGNRDNQFVDFSHQGHIKLIGNDSCVVCHHLNLPGAKLSQCWQCHTSMYREVDFFNHSWHASPNGADLKCDACHKPGVTRTAQSAKQCTACHPTYRFSWTGKRGPSEYYIPSYVDAMHEMCVTCHVADAKKSEKYKNLGLCSTCHEVGIPANLKVSMKWNVTVPHFDNVEIPAVEMKEMEKKSK